MQQDKIKTLLVNILTGAVVFGVIFAAYVVFMKKDAVISVSSVTSVAKNAERTALIGTEIDYTVRDLGDLANAVESSNAIFGLTAFKNLQDFSVAIPKESIGRENPFVLTEWKIKQNSSLGANTNITPVSTRVDSQSDSLSFSPSNMVPEVESQEFLQPETPSSGI